MTSPSQRDLLCPDFFPVSLWNAVYDRPKAIFKPKRREILDLEKLSKRSAAQANKEEEAKLADTNENGEEKGSGDEDSQGDKEFSDDEDDEDYGNYHFDNGESGEEVEEDDGHEEPYFNE